MSKYLGRWEILEMEMWDKDYIDLVEPGYFLINADGRGEFVFGVVEASIDGESSNNGKRFEYTWQGQSEGDECCGRGWFDFESSESARGKLYFHMGDQSSIQIGRKT